MIVILTTKILLYYFPGCTNFSSRALNVLSVKFSPPTLSTIKVGLILGWTNFSSWTSLLNVPSVKLFPSSQLNVVIYKKQVNTGLDLLIIIIAKQMSSEKLFLRSAQLNAVHYKKWVFSSVFVAGFKTRAFPATLLLPEWAGGLQPGRERWRAGRLGRIVRLGRRRRI